MIAPTKGDRKISFGEARRQYVHRYTIEHVPAWARRPAPNGKHYAPQFRSDLEWYDNTLFPGEDGHPFPDSRRGDCYTTGQTWPLGQWLDEPFKGGSTRA